MTIILCFDDDGKLRQLGGVCKAKDMRKQIREAQELFL